MSFYIYKKDKYKNIYRFLILMISLSVLFLLLYETFNKKNEVDLLQNEVYELEKIYDELSHTSKDAPKKLELDLSEIERLVFYPNDYIQFKEIEYNEQIQQLFINGFAQSIDNINQLKIDLNQEQSFKSIDIISTATDPNKKEFSIEFKIQGQL